MYPITTEQAWANIDRDLRGYFDFSEDDLAANQRGAISERQKELLHNIVSADQGVGIAVLSISFVIGLLIIVVVPPIGILMVIATLFFAYYQMQKRQSFITAISSGAIQGVQGKAKRAPLWVGRGSRRNKNDAVVKVWIGETAFMVTNDQYFAIVDGFMYTAYYLPPLKTILSIECDRSNDLSREYVLQEADALST